MTDSAATFCDNARWIGGQKVHFPKDYNGPVFKVDQPFLYFIFDYSSWTILLIGRCCMPIVIKPK